MFLEGFILPLLQNMIIECEDKVQQFQQDYKMQ